MTGSASRPSPVSGNGHSTREHTCPICHQTFRFREWTDVPTFPFCSLRCKQQDLGVWLSDGYAIHTSMLTGEHQGGPAEDGAEDEDADESDDATESGDD